MLKLRITVLLIIFTIKAYSQLNVPQGYFISPIKSGQLMSLSGCYGDLRINHFHAGLDIRTDAREGLPVVAAADGYISRIKVMNGGYGNSIYITHPNGYTTVYAHLKSLNSGLQQMLVNNQYVRKSWEVDLYFPENQVKVTQGQLVAYSGNTGGSAGPHLHFEIRNQKEQTLDPSQFGFKEIQDDRLPEVQLFGLKCMSTDANINGRFGNFEFSPTKISKNQYTYIHPIKASGKIGLELLAYDRANGSGFRQGVSEIALRHNGKQIYRFRLDSMSFHNKLDMNIHVNYEKMIDQHKNIHKCYVDQGNSLNYYRSSNENGVIQVAQGNNKFEVEILDSFNNRTLLNFEIEYDQEIQLSANQNKIFTEGPFLVFESQNHGGEVILLFQNLEKKSPLTLTANQSLGRAVYDMRNGLPSALKYAGQMFKIPVNVALSPYFTKFVAETFQVDFTSAIYADNFVNFREENGQLILHEDIIPLKSTAQVFWKQSLNGDSAKNKIYLKTGRKNIFIGGTWKNQGIEFTIKEFGTFQIMEDTQQPRITPRSLKSNKISFSISDNLSGIKSIEATLNGKWLLMNYEYKTGAIWAERLNPKVPMQGDLILKITDNSDNIAIFESTIN